MFISKLALAHKIAEAMREADTGYLADGFEALAYRPKKIFFMDDHLEVAISVSAFLKAEFIISTDGNQLGIWTNDIVIWVTSETEIMIV
jgi:hypothetical protein